MEENESKQDDTNINLKDRVGEHVLEPFPGTVSIELPCGYIRDDQLHTIAVVKEMGGEEEDLVVGKGKVVARLNAVIGNCLVRLGNIGDPVLLGQVPEKLASQDRAVLIMAIRRATVGDFWDIEVKCPNKECNSKMYRKIDLAQVDIRPMEDRMIREFTVTLPRSGKQAIWHILCSEDEQWLADAAKKKEDLLSLQLLSRLVSIDGVVLDRNRKYKESIAFVKKLASMDRQFLRNSFEKHEAFVDMDADYECDSCGYEWTGSLDFGQESFFFPSAL